MNKEMYRQKLVNFNSTQKYVLEREFLLNMVNPQKNERILDYGTGLGRMVHYINEHYGARCYGYDLTNYREIDDPVIFRSSFTFRFSKVFFMHSLAHIDMVEDRLVYLRDNLLEEQAKIVVITPNKDWMRLLEKVREYVGDPTVIDHFTSAGLEDLFTGCGFKIIRSGQFGAIQNGQHERLFLEATV